MTPDDYKRFMNFLTTHDCRVDFRQFRGGGLEAAAPSRPAAADAKMWVAPVMARAESGMNRVDRWRA